jgi:hypothetical protein
MTNDTTSRYKRLRKFAELLWQLGLFSLVFTGPIGASQGYSTGGLRGMLSGLAFALTMAGVLCLVAYLIMQVLSRLDRHA